MKFFFLKCIISIFTQISLEQVRKVWMLSDDITYYTGL